MTSKSKVRLRNLSASPAHPFCPGEFSRCRPGGQASPRRRRASAYRHVRRRQRSGRGYRLFRIPGRRRGKAGCPPDGSEAGCRGPGRPRLGVVSREVSLLPRHWEWLSSQRGGASAGIRRLVEIALKEISHQDPVRKAVETAYAFLSDLAGDYPGFEEASRALFAHDFAAFEVIIADWPPDVREQLGRFLARA